MKKILITGGNGQLAKSLKALVATKSLNNYQFLFFDKTQFDITNKELIETFFFSNSIDCVINCAAYTAVDLAETEVELAFRINADGVKNLAEECANQNATLIHISTDYVFDGEKVNSEYLPDDETSPINVYGKSKLAGENYALKINPRTHVVRTSWLYSEFGKNFYTTMLRLMSERDEISVVSDQVGKPTHALDLAKYILELIVGSNTDYGIHHFSGNEIMSWYDFAKKIALENGFNTKIHPITTDQYPTAAKRPKWSVLGEVLKE